MSRWIENVGYMIVQCVYYFSATVAVTLDTTQLRLLPYSVVHSFTMRVCIQIAARRSFSEGEAEWCQNLILCHLIGHLAPSFQCNCAYDGV
jgi:hypothetical protein